MTRHGIALVVAVALAGLGLARDVPPPAPTPAPAPTPSAAARVEFCSLLRKCGLTAPAACTDAISGGGDGVDYDAERCGLARDITARGIDPADPAAFRVFRFLGARYQVVYRLDGQVAISEARLAYLLDDLPLAAALLSYFQKTHYAAEYLDDPPHRRFKGRRGADLEGEATLLVGRPGDRELVYFGRGTSQIGPWKLRGLGLVQVRTAPAADGKGLRYDVRVVAAPVNAVVNLMMRMGIFRRIALGHIREVLDDIGEASAKLDKQGVAEGAPFSARQKDGIAVLTRLP